MLANQSWFGSSLPGIDCFDDRVLHVTELFAAVSASHEFSGRNGSACPVIGAAVAVDVIECHGSPPGGVTLLTIGVTLKTLKLMVG